MARSFLPAAILGAGGLIGLGLYFGLRARAPAESVVPTPVAGPPAQAEPATPAAPPPVEARADAIATVESRAKAAIEGIREALVEECWKPSVEKRPEPASMSVGLSLSFDAEGMMRGTGVIERREANRSEISQCLTDRIHALSIEGVGAPVSVEVELKLP